MNLNQDPELEATHWKQTIFYFKDDIPMKAGESIEGTILMKKNLKNHRDVDIKLSYHYNGTNGQIDGEQYFLLA